MPEAAVIVVLQLQDLLPFWTLPQNFEACYVSSRLRVLTDTLGPLTTMADTFSVVIVGGVVKFGCSGTCERKSFCSHS